MEENKSCYNCRYFYQHYVVYKYKILSLNCGHCSKRTIKVKEKSKFPFKEGCGFWEDNKFILEKQKEILTSKLSVMARDIHNIAIILKEKERNSSE